MLKEIEHPSGVKTVQFTENNGIITECGYDVIRTFNAAYEQAGKVSGNYVAENNGWEAVADWNALNVVDNEGIMLWWLPRTYTLNLQNSNITDAKEISERNKLLWE